MVVRNSSTLVRRCGSLPLHAAQSFHESPFPWRCWWGAAGAEPPGRRQRNHRHARLGAGHRLFCACLLYRGHWRHAAGTGQLALSGSARQSGHSRRWSRRWTSQASYEIQPRVFYEDFHNSVLYVQDVRAGTGAANWRQVFMADVSDPTTPLITTAASATVVNDSKQELLMRLRDGARARDSGRPAGAIQHLHICHHRFAPGAQPAKRRAPGTDGHGHLRHAA